MKKNTAFFAVARKYLEDPEWLAEPFTKAQAWLDIIGRASFADGDITRRGELLISERGLAKRWRWSRGKVEKYLAKLEKEGRITRAINRAKGEATNRTTLRIEKYEVYQNPKAGREATKEARGEAIYNNIDNIDNISLYTPTGAEAEEITRLFGEKADQLIEDVRSYYQRSPDKEFPGWLEAVKLFHSNQARWGKTNKPKRKSMDDIIAEMEAEGAFK